MTPKNKFWWFAAFSGILLLTVFTIISVLLWRQLHPPHHAVLIDIFKNHFAYLFITLFLVLTGFVFALDAIFHNYIIPVSRLAEEIRIMTSVNPSHRIQIEGSADVVRLAEAINDGADSFQNLRRDVDKKIREAKSEAEEEKNLLATFMAELPEGVLVCNVEGRILFYNKRSRTVLERGAPDDTEWGEMAGRFIGLGRSVFGVIDKNLIVHALDEIAEKLDEKEDSVATYFVAVGEGGRLLRVEAVPIVSREIRGPRMTGFILILDDITDEVESERRIDFLLQSLLRRFRSSVAGIRSAVEAIREYPDMAATQRDHFHQIIHDESVGLGTTLDNAADEYSGFIKSHWPAVRISVTDLFETLKPRAAEKIGVTLTIEPPPEPYSVEVDSYATTMALLFVIERVRNLTGATEFTCAFDRRDRFIHIDLAWEGDPVRIETLRQWESRPLTVAEEGIGLTLREVLGHHDAQLWCPACREPSSRASIRLFLPAADNTAKPVSAHAVTITSESRPEFYDFDLFNQPGQNPELDNCTLRELTYTVFDTETTGLNPKVDEIISIGAVRIVNSRLLYRESFDQLVDPRRPLDYDSIKYHGIQPDMLAGQPPIQRVLPTFHRFAEDTILVAHNAAFDMRMFQVKENETGVQFINPVLDTLLLSAVVHPAQDHHNLEDIAKRLGIRIVGRHTALGDAIAAGEVFLRLIPLLAKEGVRTLKDARLASEKTYYARMKY